MAPSFQFLEMVIGLNHLKVDIKRLYDVLYQPFLVYLLSFYPRAIL